MNWKIVTNGIERHVIPLNEDHILCECPCHPIPDGEDDTVIVHNSFDGREAFERGERKPS